MSRTDVTCVDGHHLEIRWRVYAAQRVEIVVALVDDTIVGVWITQVNR